MSGREQQRGKSLRHRIAGRGLAGLKLCFGNKLLLERTTRNFLKDADDFERTQSLCTAEFDHGVAGGWIRQNLYRQLRYIVQRNVTDLLLSRPVNRCFGIFKIETEVWTQPNFHEKSRPQDGVS